MTVSIAFSLLIIEAWPKSFFFMANDRIPQKRNVMPNCLSCLCLSSTSFELKLGKEDCITFYLLNASAVSR